MVMKDGGGEVRVDPTHPDGKRSRLRGLVGAVEGAMPGADHAALGAAWRELVTALDLGPEPATRRCPTCNAIGMAAASRCGHCWAYLT